MTPDLDVAVVGAGVSGLVLAHALQRAGRSVHVFEAADCVGGRMRTLRRDGYVLDVGAEMISTRGYQETWKLIREVGMAGGDVVRVMSPIAMWRDGRAHPNVGRPLGLLTGAGLSLGARLDLLRFNASMGCRWRSFDPDRPEATPLGDLRLDELASRYRPELGDYLFEPLAGGFFGWELERSAAGPLVALLLATGPTTKWRTYREGMDTLARRLAERLDVATGRRVRSVVSGSTFASIAFDDEVLTARHAVLCLPAPLALGMHENTPDDARPYLEACTYAPMLRVSCLLDEQLDVRGGGSPYLVVLPGPENEILSGLALDHNKAAGRAPEGCGLVSLLTRPRATRRLIDGSDEQIAACLTTEAERYLPGLNQAMRGYVVTRFPYGLPEATPAALALRSEFLQRPARTVDYAGDWLMLRPNSEGAIRSAYLAARRVLSQARDATPRTSFGSPTLAAARKGENTWA